MSQALGMGMGMPRQDLSAMMGCSNSTTFPTDTIAPGNTIFIDEADMEYVKVEPIEPPTEFEQLSNHKFHELLAKFKETR
ncbi:MAG: hypothetical protein V3V81_08000 [Candidatus Bathyarchaeia archaeon]